MTRVGGMCFFSRKTCPCQPSATTQGGLQEVPGTQSHKSPKTQIMFFPRLWPHNKDVQHLTRPIQSIFPHAYFLYFYEYCFAVVCGNFYREYSWNLNGKPWTTPWTINGYRWIIHDCCLGNTKRRNSNLPPHPEENHRDIIRTTLSDCLPFVGPLLW